MILTEGVKADHSSFFQLFCLNIFTMNGSGKKTKTKNNNKGTILNILYVSTAATEKPSYRVDLFELNEKNKDTGGTDQLLGN